MAEGKLAAPPRPRARCAPRLGGLRSPTAVSAGLGAALGAAVSFLSTATLLEISGNRFFAVYFAVVFCLVGPAILWRVFASPGTSRAFKAGLSALALVVTAGGVSCFVVDRDGKTAGLSPGARVPFYVLISVSVSFALTFGIADVVNAVVQTRSSAAWVETQSQVGILLLGSVLAGAANGLAFGLLDVEDDASRLGGLLRQETVGLPVGALVGALSGALVRRASPPRADPEELEELWAPRVKRATEGVGAGFDDGL